MNITVKGRKVLRGIAGSAGTALGRVVVWTPPARSAATPAPAHEDEPGRLGAAIDEARRQLLALAEDATEAVARDILRAQASLLDDLADTAKEAVTRDTDAVHAVQAAGKRARERLLAASQERIRSKAADVDDVVQRVVDVLEPIEGRRAELPDDAVIVARDLRPSETATMDRTSVRAFLLADAGPTAHAVILARTYGIPAVVQLGEAVLEIEEGSLVAVDGDEGTVTINPSVELQEAIRQRAQRRRQARERQRLPSVETTDGRVIRLAANIGSAEQARAAAEHGAAEIGLFRTEFLFLERPTLPGEKEQAAEYRAAAEAMGGGRVVFRTLDVGGDKPLPALALPDEPNPMLGTRGIRLLREHRALIVTQLRAILRASAAGPIGVMFPMVSGVEEIAEGLDALHEARSALERDSVEIGADVQVGAMVETPAAVLLAADLCADLDFLSIGTNDLQQYLVAADRDSAGVAHMLDPFHPALWRAIARVAEGADGTGTWVGVCGELAAHPLLQLALVGAGVDELSMVAADLSATRGRVAARSYAAMRDAVAAALEQRSAAGVREALERALGPPSRQEPVPAEEAPAGDGDVVQRVVRIAHPEGLHARPAHAFVERAAGFDSMITVAKGDVEADAKRLLEVLTLGADTGDNVRLRAQGPDAAQAIEALAELLSHG